MAAGGVLSGCLPFVLSARSGDGLCAQAERLRLYLEADPGVGLVDVAYSLATHRAHLEHRAAVVAGGRGGLVGGLCALERGESADGLVRGVAGRGGKTAFLFSGQGSQWVGMGRELYESSGVFAEHMRDCSEALGPYLGFSVGDALRGGLDGAVFERVDILQPALFAIMVSLAGMWRAFGVHPGVVLGHSQGEIAAAYVAGGLSLDDACGW